MCDVSHVVSFKSVALRADHLTEMAHDHLPDFDELLAELVTLERRERQVSDERRRLHLRLDKFPNDLDARREQAVSAERRELHVRIDALRAELRPVLGTPERAAGPPRLGASSPSAAGSAGRTRDTRIRGRRS